MKAYRPTNVPLSWLKMELAFDNQTSFNDFLLNHGAILNKESGEEEFFLDTKQSLNIT